MKRIVFLFALCLTAQCTIWAQTCTPYASNSEWLHGNLVNAALSNGGAMLSDSKNEFFKADTSATAPKLSFVSSLWLAAYDTNGNLHTAAKGYSHRDGDFYTGPLDANMGGTSQTACSQWDKIWTVQGYEIRQFIADWNDNQVINSPVPANILKFPCRNNPYFEQENGFVLPQNTDFAAFFDRNQDGVYNPMQGDYPIVPNTNGTVIAEDLAWQVFNDEGAGAAHAMTHGLPLKVEVQATFYAFSYAQKTFLNNTFYAHYKLINKSGVRYDSTRIGLWSDYDFDCSSDYYMGSSTQFNTVFAYAPDKINPRDCFPDSTAKGSFPAIATTFLNTPMSSAMIYFNQTPAPPPEIAAPTEPREFYNYLNGKCRYGSSYFPNQQGVIDTSGFCYSGNPRDTAAWSMYQQQMRSPPIVVASTNQGTWLPQTAKEMTVAFSYHRDFANQDTLTSLPSVDTMYAHLGKLVNHYNNGYILSGLSPEATCTSDCVLPGDANNDGVVNSWDYLYPATNFNNTGLRRADISKRFRATASTNWNSSLANGLNKKHLDCDGNGLINNADFGVINQNYGKVIVGSSPDPANPAGTDFYLTEINGDPLTDTLTATSYNRLKYSTRFVLRNQIPDSDFYGIAFTVELDDSVFIASKINTRFRQPLLKYGSYSKILKEYISPTTNRAYKWDILMTPTDSLNTGTNTELMLLYCNLNPSKFSSIPFDEIPNNTKGSIVFSNARIIKNDGSTLPYGMQSAEICFSTCPSRKFAAGVSLTSLDNFTVYPNPIENSFNIDLVASNHALLRVFSTMGDLLLEKQLTETRATIDVSFLQKGIYFIELSNETGRVTRRISK